ncbi:hypothetical protein KR222_008396 [Zaprionus bogoriensis]|nr:hypothetical protein KR222_008396 [Zaprionus bogoriensis]
MNLFVNGIFLVALMVLLLPHTEAAVARGLFKDAKYPGKCVVKANLILSPGESAKYPDMECARVTCEDDSYAQILTCGVEAPPPGCKLGEPKFPGADYPKCCSRHIICAK